MGTRHGTRGATILVDHHLGLAIDNHFVDNGWRGAAGGGGNRRGFLTTDRHGAPYDHAGTWDYCTSEHRRR
jgi:hypothetical protein